MKKIALTGRHATGKHRFTIVDDDMYEELSKYAWKAKPNGSNTHVYAVRSVLKPEGGWHTLRMHRVILDYTGPLDIDHINRNALDNRRENLRIVTRSVNVRNRGVWQRQLTCPKCGVVRVVEARVSGDRPALCGPCSKPQYELRVPAPRACEVCGVTYFSLKPDARFCSLSCRKKAKRSRQLADGSLPPSQAPERMKIYLREYRAKRKANEKAKVLRSKTNRG